MMNKQNDKALLKGMTLEELTDYVKSTGQPEFRAKQLYNWMYQNLAAGFDEMKNLPKDMREYLKENCILNTLELLEIQKSDYDKTRKLLFKTQDGSPVESVLMPGSDRTTLCISSQSGCALKCTFCATGYIGFKKNLSAGEIFDQYAEAERLNRAPVTNIVYMGMGEPLLNYDEVVKSVKLLTDEMGEGISRTRITLSTIGIPGKIRALAESGLKIKLALSLHSCFEDIRSDLMPVNKKHSLKENIDALKYYTDTTGTRITFEYILIDGINNRSEDLDAIKKLASQFNALVNLIPFNPLDHLGGIDYRKDLRRPSDEDAENFKNELQIRGVNAILRRSRGKDIASACGQLSAQREK